jgi:hypothetical protein
MKHSIFNPYDEYKMYKKLNTFLDKHIQLQHKNSVIYKTKPNQYLIRDNKGNLKVVSKNYYLYYIEDDECETETEFEDQERSEFVKYLKDKYESK